MKARIEYFAQHLSGVSGEVTGMLFDAQIERLVEEPASGESLNGLENSRNWCNEAQGGGHSRLCPGG
jgi:hypothetical protein